MRQIAFALASCGMLLAGCPKAHLVVPDRSIPHPIAEDAEVVIWVRVGDTEDYVKQKVKAGEGWYLAAPEVLR